MSDEQAKKKSKTTTNTRRDRSRMWFNGLLKAILHKLYTLWGDKWHNTNTIAAVFARFQLNIVVVVVNQSNIQRINIRSPDTQTLYYHKRAHTHTGRDMKDKAAIEDEEHSIQIRCLFGTFSFFFFVLSSVLTSLSLLLCFFLLWCLELITATQLHKPFAYERQFYILPLQQLIFRFVDSIHIQLNKFRFLWEQLVRSIHCSSYAICRMRTMEKKVSELKCVWEWQLTKSIPAIARYQNIIRVAEKNACEDF